MRTTALSTTLLLLLCAATALGQGVVNFENTEIPPNVYIQTGSAPAQLADEGSFSIALYWASAGTSGMTVNNSTLVIATPSTVVADTPGVFDVGIVTVPQAGLDPTNNTSGPNGEYPAQGQFIVAGWIGSQTDYASALAAGDPIGATAPFLNGVGPGNTVPNVPYLTGWSQDLIIYTPAPEPGTIAIGGLGAATLLMFRRRGLGRYNR